jgi:hypothetical protein
MASLGKNVCETPSSLKKGGHGDTYLSFQQLKEA